MSSLAVEAGCCCFVKNGVIVWRERTIRKLLGLSEFFVFIGRVIRSELGFDFHVYHNAFFCVCGNTGAL